MNISATRRVVKQIKPMAVIELKRDAGGLGKAIDSGNLHAIINS
jgi:hypothetical protein